MSRERLLRWPAAVGSPAVLDALDAGGYRVTRRGGGARAESRWDTHDGSLRRQGWELVHDSAGGEWRLEGPDGAARQPGSAGAPPASGPVAERLAALAPGRRMLPWLAGEVEEESFAASRPGGGAVETVLARWSLSSVLRPGARRARRLIHLRGDEAELERACAVVRSVARCPLLRAGLFELGLRSLGLAVPGAAPPPELSLAAADPVPAALAKLLARQALAIEANGPGVVADLDPEFVHDLRVATRRARAALRLARLAGWPTRVAVARDLAWLAGSCGPLRDLDIFSAAVESGLAEAGADPSGAAPLRAALAAQRGKAHAASARAVGSVRFARVVRTLRTPELAFRVHRSAALPHAVGAAAPALVEGELRRLARWRKRDAATLEPAELHAARLAGKRARYAMEFFAGVLAVPVRPALDALVRCQDCLGAHQDAVVAASRLEALAGEMLAAGAAPAAFLALGGLLRDARVAQRRQRRRFEAQAGRLWGKIGALRRQLRPPAAPA